MKTALLTLIVAAAALFSFSAHAQIRNPQIRFCQQLGGSFESLNLHYPFEDEVGLCRFGLAAVGSLALLNHVVEELPQVAITSYLNTASGAKGDCPGLGGTKTSLSYGGIFKAQICLFPKDGSFIELRTLTKGMKHIDNADLNRVLLGY